MNHRELDVMAGKYRELREGEVPVTCKHYGKRQQCTGDYYGFNCGFLASCGWSAIPWTTYLINAKHLHVIKKE